MSNYIDISARLEASKPGLVLGENERYEINDDKNIILKVQGLSASKKGNDIERMGECIELLLGKKSIEEIEKKHPGATTRFSSMQVIFYATMAAVTGVSLDEFEKRFQRDENNS